jgi:pimeloyl-ACP methyl ester carboxylesterase
MQNPVTRRLVFYCPGYDDEADTRYRRLLAIGLGQLRRRFGIERTIGPVETDDAVPSQRWNVVASGSTWRTETVYEVLRWDDIVRGDFSRSHRDRIPLLITCLCGALRDGVVAKLFRLDWHFASLVIFPWVALASVIIVGLAIGYLTAWLIVPAVPLAAGVTAVLTLAVAAAFVAAINPLLKKYYVYHLLNDWIFNWQYATGQRSDIEARLDGFSRRIVESVRQTGAQEVLIVGHSTGSIIAVAVARRALDLDPRLGKRGPTVALLTIGACLPITGYIRKADRFRQAIVCLATAASLLWVEYQAPQDVLAAFAFEPIRDLGLDLGADRQTNPQIRSPRFKETLSPQTYRKMKWNFFRMHFQFLMPVEIPGEYDYPMIVCGPIALAARIADPEAAVRATYGPGSRPAGLAKSQYEVSNQSHS